jgi:GH15 family glucan-1,4-alpha-glucosidase
VRIEDYAFLSDMESAALVGIDGSIDWLTFPRFDSPACFAALLGGPEHGRWKLSPAGSGHAVRRRYRDHSLVLETVYETATGTVAVLDGMPPRDEALEVVRIVEGRSGRVEMTTELVVRFDYGSVLPWVRTIDGTLVAVAGPDALRLSTPVPLRPEGLTSVAEFAVSAGERMTFSLTWHSAHTAPRPLGDPAARLAAAEGWWRDWSGQCTYDGGWHDDVVDSLVVLKGLTYAPTGALVAAATTSLPELVGGPRNWDYRYCWLRDATFALLALLSAGYRDEALGWRDWLLRAVAGDPAKLQIMYGLAGERRLTEYEVPWLPGYEGSAPVRVGNAASTQFQLDVYGEVVDSLYQAARLGEGGDPEGWALQIALLDFLESGWREADEGIWEVRGPRRPFTHSKLMAWVAFDRAVRTVTELGADGPVDRWRASQAEIREWILTQGVNDRGCFVQYAGSDDLDASLLMVPLVGFLPATDPRVVATVEAIQRDLTIDGLVTRYRADSGVDGLPPGEGAFLLCSFWLVDALAMMGRTDDARVLFEHLLTLRNDVGLLAEQYDPVAGRLLGNVPQAFSHTALVTSARALSGEDISRG